VEFEGDKAELPGPSVGPQGVVEHIADNDAAGQRLFLGAGGLVRLVRVVVATSG
jgi:hypothetical protein